MMRGPEITRIEEDGKETPMTLSDKTCRWRRDGDGRCYVKCGDFRVFGPRQLDADWDKQAHNFSYCPYCGGKLEVVRNVGRIEP